MADIYEPMPTYKSPDIYDLMEAVRNHPDFVFGAIWCKEDLPSSMANATTEELEELARVGEDLIVQYGEGFIEDQCGSEECLACAAVDADGLRDNEILEDPINTQRKGA